MEPIDGLGNEIEVVLGGHVVAQADVLGLGHAEGDGAGLLHGGAVCEAELKPPVLLVNTLVMSHGGNGLHRKAVTGHVNFDRNKVLVHCLDDTVV